MIPTTFKGESAVATLLYEIDSLYKIKEELDEQTRFVYPDIDKVQDTLQRMNLQVQKVNLKLLTALSRVKK